MVSQQDIKDLLVRWSAGGEWSAEVLSQLPCHQATLAAVLRSLLDDQDHVTAFNSLDRLFDALPAIALDVVKSDTLRQPLQDAAAQVAQAPAAHDQRLALAKLIVNMSSHASARPLLASANAWLSDCMSQNSLDLPLRVVCAVAWTKLNITAPTERHNATLKLCADALDQTKTAPAEHIDLIQPALQGLAVLVLAYPLRKRLFKDYPACIDAMLALTQAFKKEEHGLAALQIYFCLASVFFTLTQPKPATPPTDEGRLKAMLEKQQGQEEWEDQAELAARIKLLLTKKICARIAPLARVASPNVRLLAAGILLNLTQVQSERGQMLQQGAAATLLNIRRLQTQGGPTTADALPSYQAFAKLLITSNPLMVLGPSPDSPLLLEAVALLSELLTHPEASQLQQFEAVMSLTNLASIAPLADQIASNHTVMQQVDAMLLESNDSSQGGILSRRAATQLVNNLVMSETGFQLFAQDLTGIDTPAPAKLADLVPPQTYRTRLHILLALCDAQDLPTRLSAAAALAVLSASPRVVAFCLSDQIRSRFLDIAKGLLVDPAEGMSDRVLMIAGGVVQQLGGFDPVVGREVGVAWLEALEQASSEQARALHAQLRAFTAGK